MRFFRFEEVGVPPSVEEGLGSRHSRPSAGTSRWVSSPASLAKAIERPCSSHVLFVLMGMAIRSPKTCVAVNVNAIKAKHR